MNKNFYKTIFSKSRGEMVAVSENVSAAGQRSSQNSQTVEFETREVLVEKSLSLKILSLCMMLVTGVAQANIVADPNAAGNQRPTVMNSANGTPQVNIQTPTQAGVSVNQYQQFDVNQKGAILNNSRQNTPTQLGGYIQGNPWLAGGEAKVIVNQVNSSNPSHLNGYVEVGGRKADVIIANQAGINVDGGGFINAAGVTLSTANPNLQNGQVTGYNVRDGQINITGQGLDASKTDYTQILSRAASINAGVWAKDLTLVTGQNDVDSAQQMSQVRPTSTSTGSAPQVAIDTSNLGGMYAGKISLLSTESGVGINNAGQVFSSAGNIKISANGEVLNSGAVVAQDKTSPNQATLEIKATDLNNSGTLSSLARQNIETENINNSGLITTASELNIRNNNSIQNSGKLNAGRIDVDTKTLSNQSGKIVQTGLQDLAIDAKTLVNQNKGLIGYSEIEKDTGSGTGSGSGTGGSDTGSNGGTSSTAPSTATGGGSTSSVNTSSNISFAQGKIKAEHIENDAGEITANGGVHLNLMHGLENQNAKISVNRLNVDGEKLNNIDGIIQAEQGQIKTGVVENTRGSLEVQQALSIQTDRLTNHLGKILSIQNLEIQSKKIESAQGKIQSGDRLSIQSDDLNNVQGEIIANKALNIQSKTLNSDQGKIQSADDLNITANDLSNVAGTIATNRDLNIQSKTFNSQQGKVQAGNTLEIQSDDLNNAQGEVITNKGLILGSARLNNTQGLIQSNEDLKIKSTDLINQSGQITTNKALNIQSKTLNSDQGKIQSADDLNITADDLSNVAGTIATNRDLNIQSTTFNSQQGKVQAGNTLEIQSDDLNNAQGKIIANKGLNIGSTGLNNTLGLIQSNEDLKIKSTDLINQSGQITAVGAADLQSRQLNNNAQGKIQSGDRLDIQSDTFSNIEGEVIANKGLNIGSTGLNNTQGLIHSNEDLKIKSTDLINQSGQITAVGAADLQSRQLNNTQGKIQSGDRLDIQNEDLSNVEGKIIANKALNITSNRVENTEGLFQSGDRLGLQTQDLINPSGQIAAQDIQLEAQRVNNVSGDIYSSQSLSANIAADLNNQQGQIRSGQDLHLHDAQRNQLIIDNTQDGKVLANGNVRIQAKQLVNTGEVGAGKDLSIGVNDRFDVLADLNAGGNLNLSSEQDINNNKKIISSQQVTLSAKSLENQSQGVIQGDQGVSIRSNQVMNRGLVNSNGLTHVKAEQTLHNLGTGRIYGDDVAIQSQSLLNQEEVLSTGERKAGVIAARHRLDLGAKNIINQEGGLISSLGDLAIGGELNEQGQAQGQADRLINASARIEAQGNANISVNDLQNLNNHLEVERYLVSEKDVEQWKNPDDPNILTIGKELNRVDVTAKRTYFRYADGGVGEISYGGHNYGMYRWQYKQSEYNERIKNSKPGEIIIGGNLSISGDRWLNSDGQILVGGTLSGNDANLIENRETLANSSIEKVGNKRDYYYGGSRKVGYNTNAYYEEEKSTRQFEQPALIFETERAGTQVSDQTEKTNAVTTQPEVAIDRTQVSTEKANNGAEQINIAQENTSVNSTEVQNGQIKTQERQSIQLPNSSLFNTNPSHAQYLIETDPAFSNYKQWLGSDYMLKIFKIDPHNMHKRLGDGYYEQKLINDQIANLTGYRRLEGYQSDEEQFKALMDSGVSFAQSMNLGLGVSLSAEQISRLTSDIVWLVNETVTLPDGTEQTVLVPKVYLMVREGDLNSSGALISANAIDLKNSENLVNQGTIAGRQLVNLSANNIENSGLILSKAVQLTAKDQIKFDGGKAKAQDYLGLSADRVELNSTTQTTGDARNGNTTLDRVAGLYVTGEKGGILAIDAKKGIDAKGAVLANTSESGKTQLRATEGSVNLSTVDIARQESYGEKSDKTHYLDHQTAEVGTTINTAGDVSILANDKVDIRQGSINSTDGKVSIYGQQGVDISEGRAVRDLDTSVYSKTKGFLSSSTSLVQKKDYTDQSVGSVISGHEVSIGSGQDLNIRGSQVVADHDVNLQAQNNVKIDSATNTSEISQSVSTKKSGLLSSGGLGITLGKLKESTDNQTQNQSVTGSTVGSLNGNTNIIAGQNYQQTGSTVSAQQGDVNIVAQQVNIEAAAEQQRNDFKYEREQKGLTLAVNVPVVAAVQTVQDAAKQVGQSKDDRVNAIAAANAGFDAYKAGQSITKITDAVGDAQKLKEAANVSVSLTYGQQKDTSFSHSEGTTGASSQVYAGGKTNIVATGVGEQSNINIMGSDVLGKQGTTLIADNDINIKAFEQNSLEESGNKSEGFNAGVTASVGANTTLGATAGANAAKGSGNGDTTSYLNSHVGSQESQTIINSGNATNITGGQVQGKGVELTAKELNIESLQDTSTYKAKQQNISGQVSVGAGTGGVSASAGKSKIDANYASVNEQSGIYAGDDGYQIKVQNNTDLKGAIITSTQTAEDAGKNTLSTGTLTASDIHNVSEYDAKGIGISVGFNEGKAEGKDGKKQPDTVTSSPGKIDEHASSQVGVTKSIGFGLDSEHDSSVTASGINTKNITITDEQGQQSLNGQSTEQVKDAIYTNVTTDNAKENSGALKNNFDKDKVQSEINLQVSVTQQFDANRQEAKQEINKKLDDAKQQNLEVLEKEKNNLALTNQEKEQLKAYYQTVDNYQKLGLVLDTVAAGLSAPTNSVTGIGAAALSPAASYEIGQYFKGKDAEGSAAHILAHTLLGAAVAAAGGNDALTAGLSAGGAEASAPILAQYLYGKKPSDLTADEKGTISSITGLIASGIGATTGDVGSTVQGGNAAQNAVENNFLTKQGYKRKFELVNQFDKKGALTTQQAQELLALIDLDNKSTKLRKLYLEKGPSALTKQEYADLMKYIKLVAEVDGVSPQKVLNEGRFGTVEPISKGAETYAKNLLNYNNSYQQRQAESLGQGVSLVSGAGGLKLLGSSVAIGVVGGGASGYVSGGDAQSILVGAGVGAVSGYSGGKVVNKINNSIGKGAAEVATGAVSGATGTIINNKLNDKPLLNNVGTSSVVGALVSTISGRAAVSASGISSKVANTIVDVNSAIVGIGAEKIQTVKPQGNKIERKK